MALVVLTKASHYTVVEDDLGHTRNSQIGELILQYHFLFVQKTPHNVLLQEETGFHELENQQTSFSPFEKMDCTTSLMLSGRLLLS
jgi:hypothetical protein